ELNCRLHQADEQLTELRSLIAEKSFRYCDQVRKGATKTIRTRGMSYIRNLNKDISHHCQIYSRCRSRLIILGADASILTRYQELKKNDINGSTAILNPNVRGSTKLKLSWIWQTASQRILPSLHDISTNNTNLDSAQMLEFKRVHWLRARAQKDRWHEELTIIPYEMEWTVRYFLYESQKWRSAIGGTGRPISPGAAAYADRKMVMWHLMAIDSDGLFRK
ncbi:hypothetical protein BDN70DRAFT_775409, partial [Pholiota conissans]